MLNVHWLPIATVEWQKEIKKKTVLGHFGEIYGFFFFFKYRYGMQKHVNLVKN